MKRLLVIVAALALLATVPSAAALSIVSPPSPMTWPVPGCTKISVAFWENDERAHLGIDIADGSVEGKIVVAAAGGTVVFMDANPKNPGSGIQVYIEHENTYMTRYAHLLEDSFFVEEGDTVQIGQPIGRVGATGLVTGPHLHFEVIDLATGERLNPMDFVRR